jgi:hypothetical protein
VSDVADSDLAVRALLATLRPGERIEPLAVATTPIAQLEIPLPIEEARAIIRAEAATRGAEWRDEK